MRNTLTPAFKTMKMRTMFTLIEKSARKYVEFYLDQEKDFIEVELKNSMTRFGTDVIASCAFGIKVDSLKHPENEFYLKGKDLTDFASPMKIAKLLIMMIVPKIADVSSGRPKKPRHIV